jgi:hypothetical protein
VGASSTTLPANQWSHVAVTYNGSSMQLYVNGSAVGSPTTISGTINSGSNTLWIGGNNAAGEYFQGRIDEMRIYNRALSSSEVVTARDTAVP